MKIIGVAAILVTAWLGAEVCAIAAPPPTPPPYSVVGANESLSVTATSARVLLTADVGTFPVAVVTNVGDKEAFVRATTVSGSAVVTDLSVPAGKTRVVYVGAGTYIAAICGGSDSTTLRISQTNGAPAGWN